MAPSSKGPSESDLVFSRISLGLADLQRTVAAFAAPPPPNEQDSGQPEGGDEDEDADLWATNYDTYVCHRLFCC
jgi:hypothetical protein